MIKCIIYDKVYNEKTTGNLVTIVNELRGKSKSTIPPYMTINNDVVTDKRTIATEFNKYF